MSKRDDDRITLRPNEEKGEKEASAEVEMFDKTSYKEEDQENNPLEVSPDLHSTK